MLLIVPPAYVDRAESHRDVPTLVFPSVRLSKALAGSASQDYRGDARSDKSKTKDRFLHGRSSPSLKYPVGEIAQSVMNCSANELGDPNERPCPLHALYDLGPVRAARYGESL
jgi:hypothetical protein